jgi:hypothetical protein
VGCINLSDTTPEAPTGFTNVRWQADDKDPRNVSAYIPTSGSRTELAFAPADAGEFTIAHGLDHTPSLALVQMTSDGSCWLEDTEVHPRYDNTYIYLVASAGGITGYVQIWS